MSSSPYNAIACECEDNERMQSELVAHQQCTCSEDTIGRASNNQELPHQTNETTSYWRRLRFDRLRRHRRQSRTVDTVPYSETQDTSVPEDGGTRTAQEATTFPMDSNFGLTSSTEESSEDDRNVKNVPCLILLQIIANRTAEVSEHAMRALFFDILPWVLGCYLLFYCFRNGGLGLGFTAFMLLVSLHAVLKWWTTRGPEEPRELENGEGCDAPTEHRCHHHQHDVSDDSDNDTISDVDLCDMEEKTLELPPSYEAAANPTLEDLSLGLEVHLTPTEPRIKGVGVNGISYINSFLEQYSSFRRDSATSANSYMSSEVDDEFLPSYSDAVKKIKKRKKKTYRNELVNSNSRLQSDNHAFINPISRISDTTVLTDKVIDVRIAIEIPSEEVSNPFTGTVADEPISIVSMEGSSHSVMNPRINTTDGNSLLELDLGAENCNESTNSWDDPV